MLHREELSQRLRQQIVQLHKDGGAPWRSHLNRSTGYLQVAVSENSGDPTKVWSTFKVVTSYSPSCASGSYQHTSDVIKRCSEFFENSSSQCSQKHDPKSLKQRRLLRSHGKKEATVVSKASPNAITVCYDKLGPISNLLEERPLDRRNENRTLVKLVNITFGVERTKLLLTKTSSQQ